MVYSLIETIYIQFDFKLLCLNCILERTFSKDFTLISRKLLCLLSSKLTSLPLLHPLKQGHVVVQKRTIVPDGKERNQIALTFHFEKWVRTKKTISRHYALDFDTFICATSGYEELAVIIVVIQSRKWGVPNQVIVRNRAVFPVPDGAQQIEKNSSRITPK